jgi:hypothetical protein
MIVKTWTLRTKAASGMWGSSPLCTTSREADRGSANRLKLVIPLAGGDSEGDHTVPALGG